MATSRKVGRGDVPALAPPPSDGVAAGHNTLTDQDISGGREPGAVFPLGPATLGGEAAAVGSEGSAEGHPSRGDESMARPDAAPSDRYWDEYPDSGARVALRQQQFARLGSVVYLDHAGAALYAAQQVEAHSARLLRSVHGNPHSIGSGPASGHTGAEVAAAREAVLAHFGVTSAQYACVFTSGATAGARMIGECFQWQHGGSRFIFSSDSHTSVVGMREYARRGGADVQAVQPEHLQFRERSGRQEDAAPCLLAFPGECNFSGLRFPLEWINRVDSGHEPFSTASEADGDGCAARRWYVVLDAAKLAGTAPLNLADHPAHFVIVSFYKMLGFPTGVGALLIRRDAAHVLKRVYFGGGSVDSLIADPAADYVVLRDDLSARFEDGTLPFLEISALRDGLSLLRRMGMSNVSRHACGLTRDLVRRLRDLCHTNGAPAVRIYGEGWSPRDLPSDGFGQGPVVAMNVLHVDGTVVDPALVGRLAAQAGIQLRVGCFCNVGACHRQLALSHADVRAAHEDGHVCWDSVGIVRGRPTGAVRVSLGYSTQESDVEAFVAFLAMYFCAVPEPSESGTFGASGRSVERDGAAEEDTPQSALVESLHLYPVKSCAAMKVASWPIGPCGLAYDRHWAIVDDSGVTLTQKRCPMLSRIRPIVTLPNPSSGVRGALELLAPGMPALSLPLDADGAAVGGTGESLSVRVCGEACRAVAVRAAAGGAGGDATPSTGQARACATEVDVQSWLTAALGRRASLVVASTLTRRRAPVAATSPEERPPHGARHSSADGAPIAFANEGQFLLVSRASVDALRERVHARLAAGENRRAPAGSTLDVSPAFFRPNIVVKGTVPFDEDNWTSICIGDAERDSNCVHLAATGRCARCQMINIDQEEGKARHSGEPLLTLAQFRRDGGRIFFGVFLRHADRDGAAEGPPPRLAVGDAVVITARRGRAAETLSECSIVR